MLEMEGAVVLQRKKASIESVQEKPRLEQGPEES